MNQVISQRMAKKRQMRWTDEGAHCMVQVRVAVLNGELSPERISALAIGSRHSRCFNNVSPRRHQPDRIDRDILVAIQGA
ncbi:hypothetical protein [Cupriavidus necator]|uniref:hypothetical protein n=1 Tax=Cupriavidus necator TaxID=106590 RepID=UPI003F74136F